MNIAAREPIAVRELRQAARQRRTPLLLGALPTAFTLLALVLAAAMSSPSSGAVIGATVFEIFFAVATCVVVVVGATVAANGVASEREGHTWEPLLLSGLRPIAIARGKFLSAFAQAALYLLSLAPSAALAFVFGGVTVAEILVAFGLLLAVAALAVLFGLAVSSYARTARGALAGTLIATLLVGPAMYVVFSATGMVVGDVLGEDAGRGSTWLAHAITSAPVSARSVLFFVVDPLVVLVVPGWFAFEVTKANVSDPADDRSTGLRRWYIFSTLLLASGALATIAAIDPDRVVLTVLFLSLLALHLGFSALVFGGEPLAPSRRLEASWARTGGPTLSRRLLGPSIGAATVLHGAVGVVALVALYLASLALSHQHRPFVGLAASYAVGFHLFIAGATGALAVRFQRPVLVRAIVLAGAVLLAIVPLVMGAVARVFAPGDGWRLVDALSPCFLLTTSRFPDDATMLAALTASLGYGVVGASLVAVTCVTARRPPGPRPTRMTRALLEIMFFR